tara:strand:- start:178 stop:1995 length:1818 start_codon:yes stop_codon:yes gene_type:complete
MGLTLRIKYFNTVILRQEPILATTVTTECSSVASEPAESSTIEVTAASLTSLTSGVEYVVNGPGVADDSIGVLDSDKNTITFKNSVTNKIEKGVTLTLSASVPYTLNTRSANEWHIEESRIKGGFNENAIDYGPKAYAVDKKYNRKHRENAMIYSGIFNSRTGVNDTNQFSIAENITKSVDLAYGSIQKLYAEDTNLIIFQENKVNGALIDKDAIFTAEGGGLSTTAKVVIGQITPYLGEFGIGKNPESFAVFGFRKYFVDKDRASVLRLSRDGLTEISSYGMRSFFRKNLNITDQIRGFFDIHSRNYVLNLKLKNSVKGPKQTFLPNTSTSVLSSSRNSKKITISGINRNIFPGQYVLGDNIKSFSTKVVSISNNIVTLDKEVTLKQNQVVRFVSSQGFGQETVRIISDFKTIVFSDKVNGWSSFVTYNPSFGGSLGNNFYTFDKNELYKHYDQSQSKNTFYGSFQPSTITVVSNQNPSLVKHYKTINYEGTNNWKVIEMFSPAEDFENYNAYPIPGNITGRYVQEGVVKFAGFTPLEKKYYGNVIINDTSSITGINNLNTTGIKGFFAEATLEHQPVNNDNTVNLNKHAELFSLGFNYEKSLY